MLADCIAIIGWDEVGCALELAVVKFSARVSGALERRGGGSGGSPRAAVPAGSSGAVRLPGRGAPPCEGVAEDAPTDWATACGKAEGTSPVVVAAAGSEDDAGGHPMMFGGGNLPMKLLNAVNIAPICFSSASIRASVAFLGLAVGKIPMRVANVK